jgi:hypothetical protein
MPIETSPRGNIMQEARKIVEIILAPDGTPEKPQSMPRQKQSTSSPRIEEVFPVQRQVEEDTDQIAAARAEILLRIPADKLDPDQAELVLSKAEFAPGSTGYSRAELDRLRAQRQPLAINQEAWQQHIISYEKYFGNKPPDINTLQGRFLYQNYYVNGYKPWKQEIEKGHQQTNEHEQNKAIALSQQEQLSQERLTFDIPEQKPEQQTSRQMPAKENQLSDSFGNNEPGATATPVPTQEIMAPLPDAFGEE